MKKLFTAAVTAAIAISLTACGRGIPRQDMGESSSVKGYAHDGEGTAEGEIKVYTEGDGEEAPPEEDGTDSTSAEEQSPDTEQSEDISLTAEGMTVGFVGEIAFCYDDSLWEAIGQPGLGYQLTYRTDGEEDCPCVVMLSLEESAELEEVMEGVLSMYEGAEFEDARDGELGGIAVQRIHGVNADESIDLLFSQLSEGGVLTAQCVTASGFEKAAEDAEEILNSLAPRTR